MKHLLRNGLAGAVLAGAAIVHGESPWVLRHQTSGGADLWGVAAGPTALVAVGTNGTILASIDGATWSAESSGTSDWLTGVAYGNGSYIIVGDRGRILSSTDARTWTTVAQTVTTQRLNNVRFIGPGFLAVGEAGTILFSSDGTTWVVQPSGTTHWLRGIADDGSLVSGEAGTLLARHIPNPGVGTYNDSSWTAVDSGTTEDLEDMAQAGYITWGSIPQSTTYAAIAVGGGGDAFGVTQSRFVMADGTPTLAATSLAAGSRFRCVASAAHNYTFGDFQNNGRGVNHFGEQMPIIAADEAGDVFTAYDLSYSIEPNYTVNPPTSWRKETLTPAVALRAAVYDSTRDSFFVVGAGETVFQRDLVFDGRAANISTRGLVDDGDKALIGGFVIRGSAPKRVLIRGVGPALANYGVANPLAAPALTLYDHTGAPIASNSGWSMSADAAAIAAAASASGAFPLADGSNDAALIATLPPGSFTAQVTTQEGHSGIGLIEVYDLDERVDGTSRAINFSTRGQVQGGENVLIPGVSVQGPAFRKFLVRAVGPGLKQFGVATPLPDPTITLTSNLKFPATLAIVTTTDATSVASATNSVGAFPLQPGDTAMVVTLPPANYTFTVSSPSNATGVALLEVYEVPPGN